MSFFDYCILAVFFTLYLYALVLPWYFYWKYHDRWMEWWIALCSKPIDWIEKKITEKWGSK